MEQTAGEAVYRAVEVQTREAAGAEFDIIGWPMWHELPTSEKKGWEIIAHTAIGWHLEKNVTVPLKEWDGEDMSYPPSYGQ